MLFGKKEVKENKVLKAKDLKGAADTESVNRNNAAESAENKEAAQLSGRAAGVFCKMYRFIFSVSLSDNVCQVESGKRSIGDRDIPLRAYYDRLLEAVVSYVHPDDREKFTQLLERKSLMKALSAGTGSVSGIFCIGDSVPEAEKPQPEEQPAETAADNAAQPADIPATEAQPAEQTDAAANGAQAAPAPEAEEIEEKLPEYAYYEIRADRIPGDSDRCIIYVRQTEFKPVAQAVRTAEEDAAAKDWNGVRISSLLSEKAPVFFEYSVAQDLMIIHPAGQDSEGTEVKNYLSNIMSRSDWTIFHSDINTVRRLIVNAAAGKSGSAEIKYRVNGDKSTKFRVHRISCSPVMPAPGPDGIPSAEGPAWVVGLLADIDEAVKDKKNRRGIAEQIEKMLVTLFADIYEIDTEKDLIWKVKRSDDGFVTEDKPAKLSAYINHMIENGTVAEGYETEYKNWLQKGYLEKKAGGKYVFETSLKLAGSPDYRWYSETVNKMEDSYGKYLRVRRDVTDIHNSKEKEFELKELAGYSEYNRDMLDAMAGLVGFRNMEAGAHFNKVRQLTRILLEDLSRRSVQYSIDKKTIELYCEASIMHDIGKISLPDSVLNKDGPLSDGEWGTIETHSTEGAKIIDTLNLPGQEKLVEICRDVALHHHERYDGKGYPDGLVGDANAIGVQAVGMADVYDALVSSRCYKDSVSHEEAVRMINEGQCGQFNPCLLETFNACADKLKALYE